MRSRKRQEEPLLIGRMTSNDTVPEGAYESTHYCDVGFRVGDGYGVVLLGTGRLVSDEEKTLDGPGDDELNQSILSDLVRPDDTVTVWAWYGQTFWAENPKRRFEVLDGGVEALASRFDEGLDNPVGRRGHPDFVLISAEPFRDDLIAEFEPALRQWEKALHRYRRDDMLRAEQEIGRLGAKVGIVAHISPLRMEHSIVLFCSEDTREQIEAAAARQAAKYGRSLPPNPTLNWD